MPDTTAPDYDLSELFAVAELPSRLPSLPGGAKHSPSKLWAWLNLSGGRAKTLRSVLIGGRRYTTERWLREFIGGGAPVRTTRTPARRMAARERAKRELAEAGI